MAHDLNDKIKIRAFYECNDLSYAETAKHFAAQGIEVSKKTLEYWGRTDTPRWERGKYRSMEDALLDLIPPEVLENVSEEMKAQIIAGMTQEAGEALSTDVIGEMAEAVSAELIYQTLSKHSLLGMLTNNLRGAERIAANSTGIGAKATFHQMLTSTIQTVYGKKVEMVPSDPNNKILDEKEMEKMTTEELMQLMEQ